MNNHEPFRFQIEDVYDIHKDPGGHYHHFTIICGYLIEGTLRIYQSIAIPVKNKPPYISQIKSLEVNGHSSEIASAEQKAKIGFLLFSLPFSGDDIERGVAEGR